jgi:hypothetical protein
MLPVEGDGECVKIIQVENSTLDDLTRVLLGVTVGFTVPAGTFVISCLASYMAADGATVYAKDLVWAYKSALLGAFRGCIRILHGIPILLDGTTAASPIRTLAEIEHWFRYITSDNKDSH